MKVLEKKYLLPFILVTSLFALWGLANINIAQSFNPIGSILGILVSWVVH